MIHHQFVLFLPNKLTKYYRNRKTIKCPYCKIILWNTLNSVPVIFFENDFFFHEILRDFSETYSHIKIKNENRSYKGKFKDFDKKNKGQSPGARLVTEEQYFFVTRFFHIKHGLFATYLNLLRKNKDLTINDIAKNFPESYQHTVGHWFRTDMGGSLPKYEDLLVLKNILNM